MFINEAFTRLKMRLRVTESAALADTHRSVVSYLLIVGVVYFLYKTLDYIAAGLDPSHFLTFTCSLVTALIYGAAYRWLRSRSAITVAALERLCLTLQVLLYVDVIVYIHTDYRESKLVYLLLIAMVFAIGSATARLTILSIAAPIATLGFYVYIGMPGADAEYLRLASATVAVVLGAFAALRSALIRQIAARDLASGYAGELERQSYIDPLTGIKNRRSVFANLDLLTRQSQPFWFGVLDLDGFKQVNDQHGHSVGDDLLSRVASRLQQMAGPDLVVGRIGGDEFALTLIGARNAQMATEAANKVINAISERYRLDTVELKIGASIGLVAFPTMASEARGLYESADFALYKAKQSARGGVVIYNEAEAAEQKQKEALEHALRLADFDRELHLLFQPQIRLDSRQPESFEALARWNSPTLGSVPPGIFIGAAERTGQIKAITSVVLAKGLATLAAWPERIGMSFNLSAQDAGDMNFVGSLLELVRRSGVAPQRVEFEVTETAILADQDAAHRALSILAEAGCRIALDDFGSGYSSLQHLRVLPLDKIKLDRTFVRDATEPGAAREIVASVVALCERLQLRCVLEGVETEQELAALSDMKLDIIQGYLFGRPMSETAAADLIAASA
ncbi:diguanylate cyclase (GGDEF)-like protein [Rhizobium sp. SG_E_25_P2]|uniref:putative bifunctional diguanylate cyclase/phosphodiesterase n=1 Tax=Rhizobium sp. SG_E_25_P2 TaxID=2879942 RepID=UPI002473BD52|nr:EAL domain-containing protein [Rhizobium sp. SG_E_25_P2]MDH6267839.1 diguanylate cyclase (GGDEF)-like protein [Rhizobium sp. SG_E_25_P2]